MVFSIQVRCKSLSLEEVQQIKKRLGELNSKLSQKGLPSVRDDSRLAYLWASGKRDIKLEDVIEQLSFTHYLYQQTDFDEVSKKVVGFVQADLMKEGLSKKDAMIISTRYMVPAVKMLYKKKFSNEDINVIQSTKS